MLPNISKMKFTLFCDICSRVLARLQFSRVAIDDSEIPAWELKEGLWV
jgi:hypothetical protein